MSCKEWKKKSEEHKKKWRKVCTTKGMYWDESRCRCLSEKPPKNTEGLNISSSGQLYYNK